MKIAKRCLIVYMITFFALLLSSGLWNNSAREYLTAWIFYIFPLFVVAAGLVLGWLGLMIIQHSRWIKSFYLSGLNLCAIAIIVIFPGQSLYRAWYLTSHPGARYNFDDHGGLKGSDLANGFDKLYASFPHPRQFHFRGYLFTDQPPAGPGYDTTWIIYYIYQLYPDTISTRFAKVELNRGRIQILSRDHLRGFDSTYDRLVQEYNNDKREKITMLTEALQSVQRAPQKDTVDAATIQLIRDAVRDTIR